VVAGGGAGGKPFRLASRGSALARWQAEHVAGLLRARTERDVEVVVVRTTGDRVADVPLSRIGDRGLFTREVDEHVLRGAADAAVHSLKDLPTRLPEGLVLGAVLEREDPRDVVVFADTSRATLSDLPPGARVGTSSLRRRALLLAARPDLSAPDIRGNVDSRLRALEAGTFDAILLAAAGLHRLGRCSFLTHKVEQSGDTITLTTISQGDGIPLAQAFADELEAPRNRFDARTAMIGLVSVCGLACIGSFGLAIAGAGTALAIGGFAEIALLGILAFAIIFALGRKRWTSGKGRHADRGCC
jgi:hypothetical protein